MSKNQNNQTNNSNKGKGYKASEDSKKNFNRGKNGRKPGQPRKDSTSRRVNYDNTRESKFVKDVEKDIEDGSKQRGRNDIEDLARNPELIKAAGSLPFAHILGKEFGPSRSIVPGIMAIYWSPSYGTGAFPVALNQCAKSMFSKVVHANSRNYAYNDTDQQIIIQSGGQVFAALSAVSRAYMFARHYTEENAYYPDNMLVAMGFDPKDIRANLGQMWFDINNLINQTRQIWIPKTIPLIKRWYNYNGSVYTDAPGQRSQSYVYVQSQYFEFSETQINTGSAMVRAMVPVADNTQPNTLDDWGTTKDWEVFDLSTPGKTYTWFQWKWMIQRMIDQLMNSEDRGIMYGDLLNCYGIENLWSLAPINVADELMPEYNAEIMTQIENLTISPYRMSCLGQTPSGLCPIWETPPQAYNSMCPNQTILNFHFPGQPTPEAVAVATRLKVGGPARWEACTTKYAEGNSGPWTIVEPTSANVVINSSTGTEIVNHVAICSGAGSMADGTVLHWTDWRQYYNSRTLTPANTLDGTFAVMAFDWHPFIYYVNNVVSSTGTSIDGNFIDAYGDFDNFILITDEELAKMHDACLMSLMGVPHI